MFPGTLPNERFVAKPYALPPGELPPPQLSHPHIVNCLASELENEQAVIAMEFCGGGSLEGMLKTMGVLSADMQLSLLRQVAGGLSYLHGQRVIHRDLKPCMLWMAAAAAATAAPCSKPRILWMHYLTQCAHATPATPCGAVLCRESTACSAQPCFSCSKHLTWTRWLGMLLPLPGRHMLLPS